MPLIENSKRFFLKPEEVSLKEIKETEGSKKRSSEWRVRIF
jgi:hypothetical protein